MNAKLTNIPASVYQQILTIDNLTLLQRAQMMAAVGVHTLVKVPTVILNRAGQFLCEVYDVSSEEFEAMGVAIRDHSSDEVGVIALAKRAIRAPFVAIKHAGITVYRIVMSAVDNLTGIFRDLASVARDTKASIVCRFNPVAALLLFKTLQDSPEVEVQEFLQNCGIETLQSVQAAVAEEVKVKMPEPPVNPSMGAPVMVRVDSPEFVAAIERALQSVLAGPLAASAR